MVDFFNVGNSFLNSIDLTGINRLQQTQSIFKSASLASNSRSRNSVGSFDNSSYQLKLNGVNNRVGNINKLIDGYNNANNVLKAAQEGIESIRTLLNQASELSTETLEASNSFAAIAQSSSFSTSALNNLTGIQGAGTGTSTTTTTTNTGLSLSGSTSLSSASSQISSTLSSLGIDSSTASSIQDDVNSFVASREAEAASFSSSLDTFTSNASDAKAVINYAKTIAKKLSGNEELSNLVKNLIADPSQKDALLAEVNDLTDSRKERRQVKNAIKKLFNLDQDIATKTLTLASSFAEDSQVLTDVNKAKNKALKGQTDEQILNSVSNLGEFGSKSREALKIISELTQEPLADQKKFKAAIASLAKKTNFLDNVANSSQFSNLTSSDNSGITGLTDNTDVINPNPTTNFVLDENTDPATISAQIIDTLKSTLDRDLNLSDDLDLNFTVSTTTTIDDESSSVNAGDTFSLQSGDGPTAIFEIKAGQTAQELVDEINQFSFLSAKIEDGKISIKTTDGGDLNANDVEGEALQALGIKTGTTVAEEQEIDAADIEKNEQEFNDILKKINEEIRGSDYKYKNLLNGSGLDIFLNDQTDSKFSIKTNKLSTGRLGISKADFNGQNSIEKSIESIDKALKKLDQFSNRIESNQSLISSTEDLQNDLISELEDQKTDLKDKIEILNDRSAIDAARSASRRLANQSSQLGSYNSKPALLQLL